MKHTGTQPLETDRLLLRRFVMEDADALFRNWASDDEVTKYLTWPTHADVETSRHVLKDWTERYAREDWYQWAIVCKDNGPEPIGSIAVVSLKDSVAMANIGYCIGRSWWHMGITSEALQAVIDFLFREVGMQRIEARHDPQNPHSGGVMKKCGMQYEGTLRRSDSNNQGICDACYYAILAEEWEKKKQV